MAIRMYVIAKPVCLCVCLMCECVFGPQYTCMSPCCDGNKQSALSLGHGALQGLARVACKQHTHTHTARGINALIVRGGFTPPGRFTYKQVVNNRRGPTSAPGSSRSSRTCTAATHTRICMPMTAQIRPCCDGASAPLAHRATPKDERPMLH